MSTDPYSTPSIDRALRPFTALLAVGSLLAFGYAWLHGAPVATLIPGIVFVVTLIAAWVLIVGAVGRDAARRARDAELADGSTVLDLPTAPTLVLDRDVLDALVITGGDTRRDLATERAA
jgi:hypothetical protein